MHTHVDVVLANTKSPRTGPKWLLPSGCVSCQNVWAVAGSYLSLPCGGGGNVTFKLLLNHTNCRRLAQRGHVLICSCKIKSGELTESTCRSSSGNVNNKFLLNIAQVQQSSNRTF